MRRLRHLLRRPGSWVLLLLTAAAGVTAYFWFTPGPLWRVRVPQGAVLEGHSPDGGYLFVSGIPNSGRRSYRTSTGESGPSLPATSEIVTDFQYAKFGSVFNPTAVDGPIAYVTKRGNDWLLTVQSRSTGDAIAHLPLSSLEWFNQSGPRKGQDVSWLEMQMRLPHPTISPDGKHLLYFTQPSPDERRLHLWFIEERREINKIDSTTMDYLEVRACGSKAVILSKDTFLSLQPGALPQQLPKLPADVCAVEWFFDPSEEHALVLANTVSTAAEPRRPALRFYELTPGTAEVRLIWESVFINKPTVFLQLDDGPALALLEDHGDHTVLRHILTGKSAVLPASLGFITGGTFSRLLHIGDFPAGGVRMSCDIRRIGPVGPTVVDAAGNVLLVARKNLTPLGRFWTWLPNSLHISSLQSVINAYGDRWSVDCIDGATGVILGSAGCPFQELNVSPRPTLAMSPQGDGFAVLEHYAPHTQLSYWSLPLRRGPLEWLLIAASTLALPVLVVVFRRLHRIHIRLPWSRRTAPAPS